MAALEPVYYNVPKWIENNEQYFLPPVCNKMMHNTQLKVKKIYIFFKNFFLNRTFTGVLCWGPQSKKRLSFGRRRRIIFHEKRRYVFENSGTKQIQRCRDQGRTSVSLTRYE